jgi:hypothetical protein
MPRVGDKQRPRDRNLRRHAERSTRTNTGGPTTGNQVFPCLWQTGKRSHDRGGDNITLHLGLTATPQSNCVGSMVLCQGVHMAESELTAEDYESVHRAGRELQARWRRVYTLNEMFDRWAAIVSEVEDGYNGTFLEEFQHDVWSCRGWLAQAWPILTERIRSIRAAELADLDARFRAATMVEPGRTESKAEDPNWWLRRWPRVVCEVASPDLRDGIVKALRILTTISSTTADEWPGLTEAVHWLVDDTGWDLVSERGERYSPTGSIGHLLRDENEVAAVNAVLDPLLAVLADLGPDAVDTAYLDHHRWPEVAATAHTAHRLLNTEPTTASSWPEPAPADHDPSPPQTACPPQTDPQPATKPAPNPANCCGCEPHGGRRLPG